MEISPNNLAETLPRDCGLKTFHYFFLYVLTSDEEDPNETIMDHICRINKGEHINFIAIVQETIKEMTLTSQCIAMLIYFRMHTSLPFFV